jgi:FAD/FMN-containing dehydrogenase
MIDLSLMKSVRIDQNQRIARAEPGVSLGELDHETQAFGLVAPAGIVTTTGIASLTLGGGFGWTSRKFGLTCDNLLSVQMVTAEGKLVRASEEENTDLFWGVRGGGGNFGIVTSFEYKLFPHGPMVFAGLRFHSFDKAKEVLNFYRDYSTEVPDEVTMIAVIRCAPPAPYLPESIHGKPVAIIGYCYSGSVKEGEQYAKPIKQLDSAVADLIQPMKFTDLQSVFDAGQPKGWNYYWKAENLSELTDDAIDTIVSHSSNITSSTTVVPLFQMRGAVSRIGENDTAYSHRNAAIAMNINASWTDPSEAEKHIKWTRDFWKSMQPFSTGGAYINFQSQDEGNERVAQTYGKEKLKRLSALKDKYDPKNLFRLNQDIKPTV